MVLRWQNTVDSKVKQAVNKMASNKQKSKINDVDDVISAVLTCASCSSISGAAKTSLVAMRFMALLNGIQRQWAVLTCLTSATVAMVTNTMLPLVSLTGV